MKIATTKMKLLTGLAILGALASPAHADEWDQKTVFTFSNPVEIPGQVLAAGTYVFKLADSQSDRHIVQVFGKDEKRLYGTFLSIPDSRLKPAGKPIITFDERPADGPEAVRAWFYPGETFGHQFVYPKPRAVALAKVNKTPVPSMPEQLTANIIKPTSTITDPDIVQVSLAPLKAQTADELEVEIAEVFAFQNPPDAAPASSALPSQLPSTASAMPLIGLLGGLSLGVLALLRLVKAHLE